MFGITDFRWGTDDKTGAVRDAKRHSKAAHDALNDYGDHQRERGDDYETDEYLRLNKAAHDAHDELRRVRGW